MSENHGQVETWFEVVSTYSVLQSGRAIRIALALSSLALIGMTGSSWAGPHGTGVVAQGSDARVFLPYADASGARGVDFDVRRHGGSVWGFARIGDYLYLGQGAELSRYRLDDLPRPRRELVHRVGYVPQVMYPWPDQVLVAGPAEATLVSVAGSGPPRVLWSMGEAEGLGAEVLKLLTRRSACGSGPHRLVVCEDFYRGLLTYRAEAEGLRALEPLALAGPFDEGGRRVAWTGDGRAVVSLGTNDSAGGGIGLQIVDLRDPAGPTTEAVIAEDGVVAHDPVRIRDRWLFASEHRGSRGPSGWNGLAVYELGVDGGARRAFEIDLSPASIESMEIAGDRLMAYAQSGFQPRGVRELLVFDIVDPERPRLTGRAPACDAHSRDGIVAGATEARAAMACISERADENHIEIFDLRDGMPDYVGRSSLDTIEPLMLVDDFEAHAGHDVLAAGIGDVAFLSMPNGSALVDIGGEAEGRVSFFELGLAPVDVIATGGRIWLDWRTGTDRERRLASWSAADRLDLFDRAALTAGRPLGSIIRHFEWPGAIGIGGAIGMEWDEILNLFDLDAAGMMSQVGIARPHGYGMGITDSEEHDGRLWIARTGWPFIDVVDVRDPRLPRNHEPIPLPEGLAQADHLALGHGRVYASDLENGIGVVDVSDLDAPRSIALWPDRRGEVFVHGAHLLVVDGDAVEVVDPSDAAAPRTLAWARFAEDPEAIGTEEFVFACLRPVVSHAIAGDVLFRLRCTRRPGATIHDGRGRLDAIDVSAPERPFTLPSIGLGHNGRLASDGGALWAATGDGGLIEIAVRRR